MLEALQPAWIVLLVMWAVGAVHHRERADVAVRSVKTVQEGAVAFFERETTCGGSALPNGRGCSPVGDGPPQSYRFTHDFCHGELIIGPGPVPPRTSYLLWLPTAEPCDLRIDDRARRGETEMTLAYRGRSRMVVGDEAGFTAEARLPWLWWTIVARGSGAFEPARQVVHPSEITCELEGFPLTF